MLHLHIKKATVSYRPLDGIVWIGSNTVQTIQDERRIDESKPLTAYISQIRLGKPVFQTSHHMVDILIAFPQIQSMEPFDILNNLIHIEMLGLESHFIHLLQIGQQRICTMIYSMSINPKKSSMIAIISLGMQVGNSRTRIIVHQAIHQSPYLFRIDCIVWVHHLLIVF